MSAPRAVVCYDEARPGMYLRIEGQDVAAFMASAAWRAWLYYPASAVDSTDRDRILLDSGMGLRECQEMLEAIMKADGHGVEVMVDQSFDAFVNAGETYIRERSEVGLAIKAQTAECIADNPKLGPRFREFRDVVNASMVRPLRDRQMLDAFFMATVGRAADFSVPGAGKTATVLGVFLIPVFYVIVDRISRMLGISKKAKTRTADDYMYPQRPSPYDGEGGQR